jgi:hypothetical protein
LAFRAAAGIPSWLQQRRRIRVHGEIAEIDHRVDEIIHLKNGIDDEWGPGHSLRDSEMNTAKLRKRLATMLEQRPDLLGAALGSASAYDENGVLRDWTSAGEELGTEARQAHQNAVLLSNREHFDAGERNFKANMYGRGEEASAQTQPSRDSQGLGLAD